MFNEDVRVLLTDITKMFWKLVNLRVSSGNSIHLTKDGEHLSSSGAAEKVTSPLV